MAPKFADNIILTKTERLMMSNRPPDPKNARNKNVLVVGGSGSGKTRFWLKPNLLQCHSSYVITDPKGSIVIECGNVSLFGELSISTSKGVLKEADFSSPSINRLISYLLISRKNAISPQEITQTLWSDDSDNPAKNVKGLVYRLRQKFSIISDEPLVLSSASGYQLNPELHIMTDYQRFDELVSSAVRASSVINKVDILKNALDLYHGKVLSSADGEHWLIQFSTKYHLSYMGAVSELLKQLDSLHIGVMIQWSISFRRSLATFR